jgi:hypothetical protein
VDNIKKYRVELLFTVEEDSLTNTDWIEAVLSEHLTDSCESVEVVSVKIQGSDDYIGDGDID